MASRVVGQNNSTLRLVFLQGNVQFYAADCQREEKNNLLETQAAYGLPTGTEIGDLGITSLRQNG